MHLKVQKLKVFAKAESVKEASDLVRSMKTPSEVGQRIARLKAETSSDTTNKHHLLGNLITELIAVFPNAIPLQMLVSKGVDLGLEEEFILKTIDHLNHQGLVLKNQDNTNFQSHMILKFTNVPFTEGKLHVARPLPNVQFRKKKWKSQK